GSKVGEGIATGIVVELIATDERSQCKDGVVADKPRPGWRNVERLNLRPLIGRSDRTPIRPEATIVDDETFPGRRILLVKGVGSLEPGTGKAKIQMDGVSIR